MVDRYKLEKINNKLYLSDDNRKVETNIETISKLLNINNEIIHENVTKKIVYNNRLKIINELTGLLIQNYYNLNDENRIQILKMIHDNASDLDLEIIIHKIKKRTEFKNPYILI